MVRFYMIFSFEFNISNSVYLQTTCDKSQTDNAFYLLLVLYISFSKTKQITKNQNSWVWLQCSQIVCNSTADSHLSVCYALLLCSLCSWPIRSLNVSLLIDLYWMWVCLSEWLTDTGDHQVEFYKLAAINSVNWVSQQFCFCSGFSCLWSRSKKFNINDINDINKYKPLSCKFKQGKTVA